MNDRLKIVLSILCISAAYQHTTFSLKNPFECSEPDNCTVVCPNIRQYRSPVCVNSTCVCLLEKEIFEEDCLLSSECVRQYDEPEFIEEKCYCTGGQRMIDNYKECNDACNETAEFGLYHSGGLGCQCQNGSDICYPDNTGVCEILCYVKGQEGICSGPLRSLMCHCKVDPDYNQTTPNTIELPN